MTVRAIGDLPEWREVTRSRGWASGGVQRVWAAGLRTEVPTGKASAIVKNIPYLDVTALPFHRVIVETTERGSSMSPETATTRSLPDLFGLHLLVIEDDEDARQLLTDVFQFAGATVTACRDAYVGLESLDERRPDVIVWDLALPRMDGLAFLRALRAHPNPKTQRTPMIAVTAYYELYGPNELRAMGCEAYMAKPLSLDRICEAVGRLGFLAARRGEKDTAS